MIRHTLRAAVPLGLLLAAALPAQTPATPATPPPVDPQLPDRLKELKSMVADSKMAQDFQAIGLCQNLGKDLAQRNPKDKEKIAKALGDIFRTGKVRPAEKDQLYRAAADELAKFEADGSKELAKALADARVEGNVPLRAHLLLALGRTQDDKQVEYLTDVATRSPHDELRAAAGQALGNYTNLEVKARREVVKQLIRSLGSLHSKGSELASSDPSRPIDPDPENARRTLRAIEGHWLRTLAVLTGAANSTFQDWQRWLNKNPNWVPPTPPKKP